MRLATPTTRSQKQTERFDEPGPNKDIKTQLYTALTKVVAQAEHGVIPAPSVVEEEVCYQYGLEVIGRVPEIVERFYAITVERRIKHPAVVALSEAARSELFV